jgi:hypothetical protein
VLQGRERKVKDGDEKKRAANNFPELQRNEVISKPSVLGISSLATRRETFI